MPITQMVILHVPMVQLPEVNELSESERGASGFGSSGAKKSAF
jgi:dUTP pyrophosphatase